MLRDSLTVSKAVLSVSNVTVQASTALASVRVLQFTCRKSVTLVALVAVFEPFTSLNGRVQVDFRLFAGFLEWRIDTYLLL